MPITSRSWRKSIVNRSTSSPTTPTLPSTPRSKSPAAEIGVLEQSIPVLDTLAKAWDVVKNGPKNSHMSRTLDPVDDAVTTAQGKVAPFQPLIAVANGAVEQTDLGKAIKEGIDHFFEGMPIFMNALDAVAGLHPFIGVVVLAFKTVYTLELKRRDNEKKVIALYVEMKDMLGVLFLLKDVQDDKLIAPDGRSIEDRLKSIVERTADDIKLCSNVCDTYAKKKRLAKVFMGSVWDDRLISWVTLFSKRRQEFEFELSIHTSQGVDKANVKLDNIEERLKVMMVMFQQLVSPEQKNISELVAAKGGAKTLRNNDKMLLSLVDEIASKAPSAPNSEGYRMTRAKPSDAKPNAKDLTKELFEDPDVAMDNNKIIFLRKFEMQKRLITEELERVVTRESDRIIQVVKGGPHERILDRSIHELWTEMGWRGNVKARHFVLALRDYYLEKLTSEAQDVHAMSTTAISTTPDPDAWAIKFIDLTRLQPILEAFDDDASGFITITEMNRFTSSRPIEWSLTHWVAFWAVGYRASIIDYANKIEELFAKMEGVRAEVLPSNRLSIDDYFTYCWGGVHTLTAAVISLQPEPGPNTKFESHLEAEEDRLRTNLRDVNYIIDGTDTLTLITGVGRIEKTVFPLIYLLMKRHYEIMRAMRIKVLDSRELRHGLQSIVYVEYTIRCRMNDLTNIFFQQKLDPKKQFQNFAYGIFKYFRNEEDLWSSGYVRTLDQPVISYDDTSEDQDVKLEDILKHGHKNELALDDWVYDGHSIDDTPSYRDVEPPLKDILGHWHGYFYEDDGIRETRGTDTMMTFVLEPADGEHEFKADAWSNRGRHTVTGSWSKGENDIMEIKCKVTFQGMFGSVIFFSGRFDSERDALTGIWSPLADAKNPSGRIEFRRIPPRYLVVYPSIKELSDSKPRALWRFAITAVRNDVRRERWSWSYFAQRRDDRKTVISLTIRYLHFGVPLNNEEILQCCAASQRLTSADACFYNSKIDHILANTWMHRDVSCDWCGGRIGGARLFCLDCDRKDTEPFNTIDLCCAQECIAARITHRQDLTVPHEPSHRLVKVRTAVLRRRHGRANTAALAAFERVQELCAKIAESSQRLVEKDKDGEETDPNTKNPSTPELTPVETPSEPEDGQPGDAPDAPRDTTIKTEDNEGISQGPGKENLQDGRQPQDNDAPSCGKCKGRLSFPCWYCIFCKDDLFLCDSCDGEGVPDLTRSSGKHTEDHHLIRCLAPEKADDTSSSTEQRLILLEDRFNSIQSGFDDLTGRMRNIEQLLHRLATASEALSAE